MNFKLRRMASKVKVAVLGTGSLGKEHVRIYSELAAAGLVEFAGIFDTNDDTARRIAAKYKARIFKSVAEAAAARRRAQRRHPDRHSF